MPRRRVARVFHGHLATRLDQYPGDQVQSLLGAVAHQQVGGAAVHAAGVGDVMGNGFAQVWQALGGELSLGVALAAAQGIVQAAAPLVERELRLARGPADEVVTRGRLELTLAQHGGALLPALERRGSGQGNGARLAAAQRLARGDEGTPADHAAQQVVVGQPRIGLGHGLARHTQLLCQQAAWRQLGTGGQVAAVDAGAQLLVKLVGQAFAAFQANVQFHGAVRSGEVLRIADWPGKGMGPLCGPSRHKAACMVILEGVVGRKSRI